MEEWQEDQKPSLEYSLRWLNEKPRWFDPRVERARKFHAARQMLKVLDETELHYEICVYASLQEEAQQSIAPGESVLAHVRRIQKSLLRRVRIRREVYVVLGEVRIEIPRRFWNKAATKASC